MHSYSLVGPRTESSSSAAGPEVPVKYGITDYFFGDGDISSGADLNDDVEAKLGPL